MKFSFSLFIYEYITLYLLLQQKSYAFTQFKTLAQPDRRRSNSRNNQLVDGRQSPQFPYHVPTLTSSPCTSTQLQGIRGFRSWFESQFPNAMNTIDHSRNSKNSASDTFDHVLIDMNQLLHITLRRSRTEGHALTLMIQELDQCMEVASPAKSIVLAFDGPPAAAKLATQRTRRYGTVMRAERKKARKELLRQRGIIPVTSYTSSGAASSKSKTKRKRGKRKNKEEKEEETLKITPGTEFMDRAHDAVLYWAWQRLENPRGKLSKCRIYISPSNVPGEGEVKLLDWLIQAGSDQRPAMKRNSAKATRNKSRRIVKTGDSVAILGGDSDLVLEGLVIPPSITHNVFVILPSVGGTSYVVSLWETTLALGRFLAPQFDPKDCMFVRTDLVLLLIMNGNDYLPKLRGSAGFNKLFHTYLRLLKTWLKERKNERPYLIDPNTLEFNLPFCIAFFQTLANVAPKQLTQPSETLPYSRSITPLSHLHSLVVSAIIFLASYDACVWHKKVTLTCNFVLGVNITQLLRCSLHRMLAFCLNQLCSLV